MDIIVIILVSVSCLISVSLMIFVSKLRNDIKKDSKESFSDINSDISSIKERTAIVKNGIDEIKTKNESSQAVFRAEINETIKNLGDILREEQKTAAQNTSDKLNLYEKRLGNMEQSTSAQLNALRSLLDNQLSELRSNNEKQLNEIRNTVDEKLQTSLEEKLNRSFETVSKQLEQVYKGLGEMQTLASGVGDLKRVLSNVKSRGILGEMQLENILQEILAPEQYCKNVITIPDTTNRVEFAIKLPGDDNGAVLLPIDSKFPGDTYEHYRIACENGDKALIEASWKELERRLKSCADDIKKKYVMPPYTTNFGIMFLPFEGLYAEAVDHGMVELLQREYSISITGPSTMAAMLNSLYMGFRTLAIQKRSNEVWQILGAVRSEFEKFNEALRKTQEHIRTVDSDLEKLIGTRSRKIFSTLKNVEATSPDALNLLDSSEE